MSDRLQIKRTFDSHTVLTHFVPRLITPDNTDEGALTAALWMTCLALDVADQTINALIALVEGCPFHTGYRGRNAPKTDCPTCSNIYKARRGLERGLTPSFKWAEGSLFDRPLSNDEIDILSEIIGKPLCRKDATHDE